MFSLFYILYDATSTWQKPSDYQSLIHCLKYENTIHRELDFKANTTLKLQCGK